MDISAVIVGWNTRHYLELCLHSWAIDWILMKEILRQLAGEGMARAFGEAAEWNKASLSSFAMTSFAA